MWMFHLDREGSNWEKVNYKGGWPVVNHESSSHSTDDQTIWTLDEKGSLWKFEFLESTWTKVGWNMGELQIPKIFGVGHLLLLIGTVDGNSYQIYRFNAKYHKTSQTVKFVQMIPVDQDSKNVIDCIDYVRGISRFLKSEEYWIIRAGTIDARNVENGSLFKLNTCDEEIQPLIDYMPRIQMSEKDADMNLVVGKDKTTILLHKIVMQKSPWVDRCATCFLNRGVLLM